MRTGIDTMRAGFADARGMVKVAAAEAAAVMGGSGMARTMVATVLAQLLVEQYRECGFSDHDLRAAARHGVEVAIQGRPLRQDQVP